MHALACPARDCLRLTRIGQEPASERDEDLAKKVQAPTGGPHQGICSVETRLGPNDLPRLADHAPGALARLVCADARLCVHSEAERPVEEICARRPAEVG